MVKKAILVMMIASGCFAAEKSRINEWPAPARNVAGQRRIPHSKPKKAAQSNFQSGLKILAQGCAISAVGVCVATANELSVIPIFEKQEVPQPKFLKNENFAQKQRVQKNQKSPKQRKDKITQPRPGF